MALTDAEDRLVMTALGGPAGDNDIRRALRKWFNEAPLGSIGNVAAGTIVAEELCGDGVNHVTKLTLTDFVVNATEPDNADLAIGAAIYNLPGGAYLIENADALLTVHKEGEATIADGEIAIGTVVGAGAVDTTGEVAAAAENVCGPIVVTTGEFDGAQKYQGSLAPNLYIAASGGLARTLFLNIAATWPDVEPDGSITASGTITFRWRKID